VDVLDPDVLDPDALDLGCLDLDVPDLECDVAIIWTFLSKLRPQVLG
jgi:hypothetical protein